MKRSENVLFCEEEQQRKVKKVLIESNRELNLTSLTGDEIQIIMSFQTIGEILFLSLTCKEIYQQIEYFIKQQHPILFSSLLRKEDEKEIKTLKLKNKYKSTLKHRYRPIFKEWSIIRALMEMNKLMIYPHVCDNIFNFLKEENKKELNDISNKFYVKENVENLINILKLKRNKNIKVDMIEFQLNSKFNNYNYTEFKILKEIEMTSIPLGFTLRKLKLRSVCSLPKLYEILSNCLNLEYLYLSLDDDEESEVDDEAVNNTIVKVPIFKQLKSLIIKNCYNGYEIGIQFIFDILKLSPNLKYFRYKYGDPPTSELLIFLYKNCKCLKKLIISDYDDGVSPLLFSDNQILTFLQNIPSITYLSLSNCNNVKGQLFIDLGKYAHNLEYLLIERGGLDSDVCDILQDLYIGGGILSKLKYIKLKGEFENSISNKFHQSLCEFVPNLKELNLRKLIINGKLKEMTNLILSSKKPIKDYLNCEDLEILDAHNYSTQLNVSILKDCKWKKLRNISICFNEEFNPKEWLYQLLSSCPQLELIIIKNKRKKTKEKQPNEEEKLLLKKQINETVIEILKEEKNWPKLYYFECFTFDKEMKRALNEIRPLLLMHKLGSHNAENTKEEFNCEWLYADKLKKEKGYF
ncbi:hypothetical protein ABK040_015716 [Willaertia magna]